MVTRTIRDMFTADIDAIHIDEPEAFAQAQEFMKIVMPRYADRIKHFGNTEPLFYKFGVEEEIAKIRRQVGDAQAIDAVLGELHGEAVLLRQQPFALFHVEAYVERSAIARNVGRGRFACRPLVLDVPWQIHGSCGFPRVERRAWIERRRVV